MPRCTQPAKKSEEATEMATSWPSRRNRAAWALPQPGDEEVAELPERV
jgi:hypothetical protein